MGSKLCQYCGQREVAQEYANTCSVCVFDCCACYKETPYELGYAGSDVCDNCANITYSWEEIRNQFLEAIKNLERAINDKV